MNMCIHLSDPLPNSRLCLFSPVQEPVLAEPGTGPRAELARRTVHAQVQAWKPEW